MPEGHTIHRLARDLRRDLKDEVLDATSRQERFAAGAAQIDGTRLVSTEAYGKHLFIQFDAGEMLHVHLGLIGKFVRREPHDRPSESLRLRLATDEVAWDLTGPMITDLVDPGRRDDATKGLGPDPLRRDGRPEPFVEAVSTSRRAIAALLLDQSIVAGIGNVYRAEALFLRGIHPRTPGSQIEAEELHSLWDLLGELLREGVRRNRIVTVIAEERPRGRIHRVDSLYVYERDGMACRRCSTPIEVGRVDNRKVWWCPTCQPEDGISTVN